MRARPTRITHGRRPSMGLDDGLRLEKASRPNTPNSLPMPDCLTPPNGASNSGAMRLISTVPACRLRGDAHGPFRPRREHIGLQPYDRIVGDTAWPLPRRRSRSRTAPGRRFPRGRCPCRCATSANTVGRTNQPARQPGGPAFAAGHQRGALRQAEPDEVLHALVLGAAGQRSDVRGRVARIAHPHGRHDRRAAARHLVHARPRHQQARCPRRRPGRCS
jgi:hypothetical protein